MRAEGRAWTTAFLLLLLAVPAAAGVPVAGTATRLDVAGHALFDGPLRGWSHDRHECAGLMLTGTALDAVLEVDRTTIEPAVAGIGLLPATTETERHDLDAATLTVVAAAGCRVVAVPLAPGSAAASLEGRSVLAAAPALHRFDPFANASRPPTVYLADGALALAIEPGGRLALRGDLRLVLWGANGTFAGAGGTVEARTGQTQDERVAGAPVAAIVATEAYLTLRGADLSIGMASPAAALLGDATVAMAAGSLALPKATLTVAGQAVPSAPAVLHAPLAGTVAPAKREVRLELPDVARVEAAGVVAEPARGAAAGWAWWAAGAAALALAAAAYAGQRRSLRRRMERRQFRAAAAAAARLAWIPVAGRDARVAEAVALLRAGELARAERRLLRGHGWGGRGDTRDYLLAHLRALQGRRADAVGHLASCLAVSPGYVRDAAADPVLRSLVADALAGAERRRKALVEGYV